MDVTSLKHMLRTMAWEKAKGQLMAALCTFEGERERFDIVSGVIDDFISKIDDEGLLE